MAVKKGMDECCHSGCSMQMCSCCGWAMLILGALLVLAGLNYLPPMLNPWVIIGLGMAICGVLTALKICKH